MKQAKFFFLIFFPSLLGCGNAGAEGTAQLTAGGEYTSGKYGGTEKTEIWYFPITGKYAAGPWLLKLDVPYLRITGVGNATMIAGNMMMLMPLAKGAPQRTASGLGDVVAGASYALYENTASGVMFDLTGKIKFGTADKDQGLGTGKNDYAVQGDLSKQTGKWGIFAGLGRKKMGSTPDLALKDAWYGSTGLSYKISSRTIGGLIYDHRGEIVDGGSKLNEVTAFVSQKISPDSKIQCYILRGFSNASPDWGAGLALSMRF